MSNNGTFSNIPLAQAVSPSSITPPGGTLTVQGNEVVTGNLTVDGTITGLVVASGVLQDNATIGTAGVGYVPLTVEGYSSSQSADLMDIYQYPNGPLALGVSSAGNLTVSGNLTIGGSGQSTATAGSFLIGSNSTARVAIGASAGSLSGGQIQSQSSTVPLGLFGEATNGATAVAVAVGNTVTLSTAGAKLLSIDNNGAEKAFVDYAGNITASGIMTSSGLNFNPAGTQPSGSQPNINWDGTNLNINVPTGGTINFEINGSQISKIISGVGFYSSSPGQMQAYENRSLTTEGTFFNGGTGGILLESAAPNTSAGVALKVISNNTLSTPGAQLVSVQNNGTIVQQTDYAGNFTTSGIATVSGVNFGSAAVAPNVSVPAIYWDGSYLTLQSPVSKGIRFNFNGGAELQMVNGYTLQNTNDSQVFLQLQYGGTGGSILQANTPNNSTALAWEMNTHTSLTNQGAALLSVLNSGASGLNLYAVPSTNPIGMNAQLNVPHIGGASGTPTNIFSGPGASSATNLAVSGHDLGGLVGFTNGGTGSTSSTLLGFTWVNAYASAPYVSLTPANVATATIIADVFPVPTVSGLRISTAGTAPGAGTYAWYYHVIQ